MPGEWRYEPRHETGFRSLDVIASLATSRLLPPTLSARRARCSPGRPAPGEAVLARRIMSKKPTPIAYRFRPALWTQTIKKLGGRLSSW
jgi:hypothetical protein